MKKTLLIILFFNYFHIFFAHTIMNTSNQTIILADHKQTIILLHPHDSCMLQTADQTTWHIYMQSKNTTTFQLFCHLYILSYSQEQTLNLQDLITTQHERIINSVFVIKYPKTNMEQTQEIAPFDFSPTSTNNLLAAITAQQEKNKENRPTQSLPQTYTGQAFIEKIETAAQKNKQNVHPFAKSSRK